MIAPDKLALLKKQKLKFTTAKATWREAFNKEFVKKVDDFISTYTKKLTGQFNIVPSEIDRQIPEYAKCFDLKVFT